MIRWMLQRGARAFGRKYRYDVSYLLDVIEVSRSAGVRMALFPSVVGYRGPDGAKEIVAGAMLASTMDGDCGPCAQLVVDMSIETGVEPEKLRACFEGRSEQAGEVGLGFDFAFAAIAGDVEVDSLAQEISEKFGRQALAAAAFAAASGRFYPVFKRALGHGAICRRLQFGEHEGLVLNEQR